MSARSAAAWVRLLPCLLLLAWALPTSGQERAVEVYRAKERPAEELLGLAQTALGEEGSAAVDPGTNSVILMGSRAAVERAGQLLRMQDRGRRNVVLRYESRRRDEIAAAGIRIDWQVDGGTLRVGNVIVPGEAEGARVRSSALASERAGGFQGVLRILDGEVGEIGSGRSVPVRTFEELAFVEAERGFLARPRVLGDGRIQVEIAPSEGRVGRTGRTRFLAADTTVVVRPGETVAIGELSRRADRREAGARVLRSERTSEERILLLTVELEGDTRPRPAGPAEAP